MKAPDQERSEADEYRERCDACGGDHVGPRCPEDVPVVVEHRPKTHVTITLGSSRRKYAAGCSCGWRGPNHVKAGKADADWAKHLKEGQ